MHTLRRLERCLLPPPEIVRWRQGELTLEQYTTLQKVAYVAINALAFFALVCAAPFTLLYDSWSQRQIQTTAPQNIVPNPIWPPEQRGFACSLFQTSGLGTEFGTHPHLRGKNDWNGWMQREGRIAGDPDFNPKNFFTDVLSDPTIYIQMLLNQGVTAHRFSLEWAVIQPEPGADPDPEAVALYRNFIRQLRAAGITPSITLNHFVVPQWFYERGNFQTLENIDLYVEYALRAMELFPEVTDWWSFNELGIKALQQAREVYPTDLPEGSSLASRIYAAGTATRNMVIAHCKLHQEVKQRFPQNTLGVTHQWLQFDTASGNVLENLVAYYLQKFAFDPVYNFFKEGRFSFEFPGIANLQFEIPPEEFATNGHFLERLGVQAYPKALLKIGLNNGQTYPGSSSSIQNFPLVSCGATCEEGGVLSRFGPRLNPTAIEQILDEAFALTRRVAITEFGSDAQLWHWGDFGFQRDEETQARHLRALLDNIEAYCRRKGVSLEGLFCWSDLIRQLEWELGHQSQLGLIHPEVNAARQMMGWRPTRASQELATTYRPFPSIPALAS
jgi:beta-glucosidase/6-phospho-beta-glucosidase/beta-galactosidase